MTIEEQEQRIRQEYEEAQKAYLRYLDEEITAYCLSLKS